MRRGAGRALVQVRTLPAAAAFRQDLDSFLTIYGNRCGYGYGSEAMFQVPTWHEQSELVLQLLTPYLDPAVEPPARIIRHPALPADATERIPNGAPVTVNGAAGTVTWESST